MDRETLHTGSRNEEEQEGEDRNGAEVRKMEHDYLLLLLSVLGIKQIRD